MENIICVRVDRWGAIRSLMTEYRRALEMRFRGTEAFDIYTRGILEKKMARMELRSIHHNTKVIVDFVVIPDSTYKTQAMKMFAFYNDMGDRYPNFYLGFEDANMLVDYWSNYLLQDKVGMCFVAYTSHTRVDYFIGMLKKACDEVHKTTSEEIVPLPDKKDVSNIICVRVENSNEDYRRIVRQFKTAIEAKYEGKVAFGCREHTPYLNGGLKRLEIIDYRDGYVEPPTVIVDFVAIPTNPDYKITATILYKMYEDTQLRIPNFYIGFSDISLMVKFLTIYHQCCGFEKNLVTWRTPRYENTYLSMFDMAHERACTATAKKKLNDRFGIKPASRDYVDTDNVDAMRYGIEAMRKYWEDKEASIPDVLKDLRKYEEGKAFEVEVHKTMELKRYNGISLRSLITGPKDIKKVIFNDPATVVIWYDGTKTVVKATNEKFDPEKGLAMAFAKKYLGNEGNYYETFKKWLPKEVKKNEKPRRRSVRKKKA